MIRSFKPVMATIFAFAVGLTSSCASSSDEEMEDIAMEEYDQEEMVEEELVEEPAIGSSEISSDEASEETELVEESSESLASELDKLAAPDSQPTDALADPMTGMETVSDPTMMDNSMAASEPAPMDTSIPEPKQLPVIDGEVAEYVVQPGDTLGAIASKVYGTSSRWPQLASDNAINQPSLIYPGDVIRYRVNDRARDFKSAYEAVEQEVIMVQDGDSLEVIAERLFGRRDYWKPMWLLNRNEIPNPNLIYSGQIIRYLDPKKVAQTLTDKGLNMAH
ncbi:LysM peptidoglycan-binding domain-containing protein [Pseudobacteriovorax antillogorgiicola]|uniref:LysM domain-containing protein n=1 Tax=Pseudobacteriovorax antillogorgiicola TaxID=1513793 RepID=A0A1Y6B875_9BACT|nr:LysM domain-containing protein [Pseudobacteriovorax antillogorgiicola]TCS59220.1 LysM domain-containing protein [Pseudobacteriovorax antillogorgiicola]SME90393.1 LysM domain-containing protein [Pseudobacteriovorax antillogorgiicola]